MLLLFLPISWFLSSFFRFSPCCCKSRCYSKYNLLGFIEQAHFWLMDLFIRSAVFFKLIKKVIRVPAILILSIDHLKLLKKILLKRGNRIPWFLFPRLIFLKLVHYYNITEVLSPKHTNIKYSSDNWDNYYYFIIKIKRLYRYMSDSDRKHRLNKDTVADN